MTTQTQENQPGGLINSTSRKYYVTKTPYIYEWQLRAMGYSHDDIDGDGYRVVSPYDSYIYGITGGRGSGKDETLTLLAMIHMANGIPACLNYPMKFKYYRQGGDKAELLEAEQIDMEKWLKHSDDYRGYFIGISEFQDWDPAYRQMSNQSLIIHAWVDQIRKLECSFGYTTKRLEDVGGKSVSETDIHICCMDVTDSIELQDGVPHGAGAMIKWEPIRDLSGQLTKRMGSFLLPKLQPMYQLWGSYNTLERFDFFEAMRGVKLELGKRIIGDGDGNGHNALDLETAKVRLLQIMQSCPQLTASEIMDNLGISMKQWKVLKYQMPEWGIETKISNGQRIYYPSSDLVVV